VGEGKSHSEKKVVTVVEERIAKEKVVLKVTGKKAGGGKYWYTTLERQSTH